MQLPNRLIAVACLVALGCAQLTGCGGRGGASMKTGTVQGKVTIDGAPVSIGKIYFVGQNIADTASADLQSDGTYSLQYGTGFRIPAADYRVCLGASNKDAAPPDPAAMMENPEKYAIKPPPVPEKYLDAKTSGLIAAVNEGQNKFDFDLKSK